MLSCYEHPPLWTLPQPYAVPHLKTVLHSFLIAACARRLHLPVCSMPGKDLVCLTATGAFISLPFLNSQLPVCPSPRNLLKTLFGVPAPALCSESFLTHFPTCFIPSDPLISFPPLFNVNELLEKKKVFFNHFCM